MSFLVVKQCFRAISVRSISSTSSRLNKLVNLTVDDKTGIATLEMNRAPVNSLNTALLQDISSALTEVEKNQSKGLILTSTSPKVFSAGLDIMELYKPDPEKLKLFWTMFQRTWLQLYGSSFPTAAAINGHAPAGGCLFAMSCEYRAMCSKLTIGLNEVRLGIIPTEFLVAATRNTISLRETEKALTTGKLFKTTEALKIGLIDEEATDKADAIKRCTTFLLQFAKMSPDARAITKKLLRGKEIAALEQNLEQDLQKFLLFVNLPKFQKGLDMYLKALKANKSR